MADAIAVIPARYASVRFPGKVLADRTGKPLVQHVYERTAAARRIARVIVAADDPRIVEAVRAFGGEAVLTRGDHANGTSRIAEVAPGLAADVIVNVQGDEPDVEPGVIDRAVDLLEAHPDCVASTVGSPFAEDEDPADPNIVKVVVSAGGLALYFSRFPIPYDRDRTRAAPPLKHVGLYVYRRDFLSTFVNLPATPLERSERLEQLHILEHGYAMAVAVAEVRYHGIDTPQQYEEYVRRMGSDLE